MNNTMTIEQVRQMVHRFATDDEFRTLFEGNPANALAQLGVPENVIAGLDAKCLKPCKLGSKAAFQAANAELDEATAQQFASFLVPAVSLGASR